MDRPFTAEKPGHIVRRVRDLDKSIAFSEMLGARPEASPGTPNVPMALGPTNRVLLHHEPEHVPDAEHGNLQHFALGLGTTHDIGDLLEYVRAHGPEPFDGPKETWQFP